MTAHFQHNVVMAGLHTKIGVWENGAPLTICSAAYERLNPEVRFSIWKFVTVDTLRVQISKGRWTEVKRNA